MSKAKSKRLKWETLLLRLLSVLVVYILCKVLFTLFNIHSFKSGSESEGFSYWINLIWGVLRYDLAAISFINMLYIFLTMLPCEFTYHPLYRKTTAILTFYTPNILAFAFDFIDIIYSRFTQRRMTFDVFKFAGNEESMGALIPIFLRDYWYVFILFLLIIGLFIFVNVRLGRSQAESNTRFSYWLAIPVLIVFMGLSVLGARGGFQMRPLAEANVSAHAKPQHYMLVSNTPFTMIKSVGKSGLEIKHFLSEEEAERLFPTRWTAKPGKRFSSPNIVILIMESFSAEFSKELNPNRERSLTPNLDSIGRLGMMLPFYANGTRSMEGLPALLASLPTWMDGEYLTSQYSNNQITALPALLKRYGYTTAFYHGGKNGTMHFNTFTQLAGFDYYFGKNEYGNDAHFDGSWGIYDDYYLPYCAREISMLDTPFLASAFTLSSHHPFHLSKEYLKIRPDAEKSMPASIEFADWALGKFFAEAVKQPWFENTIFIITADHAALSQDPYYKTRHARYAIPFVIYAPNFPIDSISKSFGQQIDLLPTVLDILGYPDDCFTFGNSLYDNRPPYAINFQNGIYQIITKKHVILSDSEEVTGYYDFLEDPFLENNRKKNLGANDPELLLLRSAIQQYNNNLIQNKLTID
ncbi:sulfatase-like hydrolase/transferase [Bacteroidales bacterium OttesenSCG-928-B11]|nr:sulfatase-like hydrolase/transferase [Bacteroidales bacterium OttesenSCG-928-E04]MDL2313209.1 sulfatase-like hydrolase/transferase [Bacteroidales bacterium OttesenSCG-928-B11]MDL2326916.1 sulfatase-like hydrolase/transferase [Bacteroidales bacterium OttesenSCG-928-A14]